MKKKRLLGIGLFFFLLIMTACSGNVDVAPGDSQEYGYSASEAPQEYDRSTSDNPQEYMHSASEGSDGYEYSASEGSDEYDHSAPEDPYESEAEDQEQTTKKEDQDPGEYAEKANLPEYGEYYYDLENVVLYLEIYDELPPNYITKRQAQELGWEGGSVEKYKEGAAIGGDTFGNREGLLPKANGRSYKECDIDTNGYSSRGSRRLVFSNDGLYFYTSDHYETFSEVTVTEEYEVVW